MALDNGNGQFPDGGVWTIGTSATAITVPPGVVVVYAQNKTGAGAVVTFDPTGDDNVEMVVSATSPSIVWSGASVGGNRSVSIKSDTVSTPVHLVMFSNRP